MAVDATGRAPGRGAYLCRDASCWDTAGRKKAIEHALKAALPAGLAAILAAGPDALAAGPDAPAAVPDALAAVTTITTPARADGSRSPNPDTMSRGEAHGQE